MTSTGTEVLDDVGLIVVAAGSGMRLGANVPKAFVPLNGRTLLHHALERLAPVVAHVVVVAPADELKAARRIALGVGRPDAVVVAGGATRTSSVAAGLEAMPPAGILAIHDAARPLVDAAALRRAVAAVAEGADAAAPAIPVTDTLKEVVDADGTVHTTLDRRFLRSVQTPQVFRREVLARAHATGGDASDDLALVERIGGRVVLVAGSPRYLKITVADDLVAAAAFLNHPVGASGDAVSSP